MSDKSVATTSQSTNVGVYSSTTSFEEAQRMAKALSQSSLVPASYRGAEGFPNCIVAIEMAQRTGISPLSVMQNLHVIQGRPSWSSSFIMAMLNACPRFKGAVRFKVEGTGMNMSCYAEATDAATGEIIKGPVITMEMAKEEGWLSKGGSKWKTMPEVMIRYRAASFFGRLYASDYLMGLHSEDEIKEGTFDTDPVDNASALDSLNAVIVEDEPKAPAKDALDILNGD